MKSISPEVQIPCLFCGAPEHVEVFEIWGHEFMLETCCADLHEQIVADCNDDPAWAKQLLQSLHIECLCGHRLRRLADDGGCGLVLDWQLRFATISHAAARNFVARNHAHCGLPPTWRFHQAVYNGHTLIGVALVGNPVARALTGRGILEVNRLCIRRDIASALCWNSASMLYGWCAREAARRGWQKIITYTREDESGTSLRAAGWSPEAKVRGRGWHSLRRSRSNTNSWINKIRWAKSLKQARHDGQKESTRAPIFRSNSQRLDGLLTYGDRTSSLVVV
jgi:hypothetical protein